MTTPGQTTRFTIDVAHRPNLDGTVMSSPHLTFAEVLEAVSQTWIELLGNTGRDDLDLGSFAVGRVESDFRHEMFVGELVIETWVADIGTSSLTLDSRIHQNGRVTGQTRVILVHVTTDRTASVALNDEQRATLTSLSS